MKNLNTIGLDKNKSEELSVQLNKLLANYSIFYQNVRGFHWNIKGKEFFELHVKFEELYNDLFIKIDDLAERILTLGFRPNHQYSIYYKDATIKEVNKTSNGNEGVKEIVSSFSTIINLQREILNFSNDLEDEGTSALMSDYIREQEKLVWMYNAYLS